jgi:hypothetical protein
MNTFGCTDPVIGAFTHFSIDYQYSIRWASIVTPEHGKNKNKEKDNR